MPKKKSTKKSAKVSYLSSNKLIYGVVAIAVIAILVTVVPATFGYATNQIRLQKINDVYTALDLDDSYMIQSKDVFGEKRVYEWDKSRTYSSMKQYIKAAPVDTTTTELRKKIEAAGFTFHEEPYPGSMNQKLIFKSDNGTYVRLDVSSKTRDDVFRNKFLMKQELTDADYAIDANSGPSNVIIKVNLDDNNE